MVQMTRRGIRTRLPEDFSPEKFTVLCGRGKEYTSSTGNKHLKSLVQKYLKPYSQAQSKIAKSSIVSEIMGQIKGLCSGAAFVKLEKEAWFEVDDAFAREKIGKSTQCGITHQIENLNHSLLTILPSSPRMHVPRYSSHTIPIKYQGQVCKKEGQGNRNQKRFLQQYGRKHSKYGLNAVQFIC